MTDGNNPLSPSPKKPHKLRGLLIFTGILVFWIWGLNRLFLHYTSESYFVWYVRNGTLISIATAFFALIWEGLDAQKGLLSWHPGIFLASCMDLAGVFYLALAANLAGPLDGVDRRAGDAVSILEALWDSAWSIVLILLMGVSMLGWLVVVAPLFYLLTLLTGAPARREIRGTGRRVVVKTEGLNTTILEQPSAAPIPENAVDVSFGTRPFALTNALNAAVLFLAEMLLKASG